MRHYCLKILLCLLCVVAVQRGHASQPCDTLIADDSVRPVRPVLAAYTAGVGALHLADTYLTPLKYSGWNASLRYERMQAMRFSPDRWVMQLQGQLDCGRAMNPTRNASMWDTQFNLDWAMMRRFRLNDEWHILAGGMTGIELGALYLARNGNNPVAAKAAWTVSATAAAVCNRHIGRLPVTFRYQAQMPLTGIFFSPDYGELYYEIYLGNTSGLVHGAWPGNYFKLDNDLTADLHFGATTLRVGYQCNIFSSKVSNIVSRRVTHMFVVGVVAEWLSLDFSRRYSPKARVISAMY